VILDFVLGNVGLLDPSAKTVVVVTVAFTTPPAFLWRNTSEFRRVRATAVALTAVALAAALLLAVLEGPPGPEPLPSDPGSAGAAPSGPRTLRVIEIATVIVSAPERPSGDSEVITTQKVRGVIGSVEAMWTQMGRGHVAIRDLGVHGPYALPAALLPDHGPCPVEAWRRWADENLIASGVNLALKAYVLSGGTRCESPGSFAPWIGGGVAWFDNRFSVELAEHELGHAMGLQHAHLLPCGDFGASGIRVRTVCPSFRSGGGDDPFDPMGEGAGSYSASNLMRLGWLDPSEVRVARAGGLFTLTGVGSASPGVRLLRIPLAPGSYYEIEYRSGTEFHRAWPAEEGLLIRLIDPGRPFSCLVVTTRVLLRTIGPIELPPSAYMAFPGPADRFEDPIEGVRINLRRVNGTRVALAVSQSPRPPLAPVAHRRCGPHDEAAGQSI
jgi:hypothetical protein